MSTKQSGVVGELLLIPVQTPQPSNFFLNPEIDFGSIWFNNMTGHYPWTMGSYPKHFQPTNINLIELSKGRVKVVICILEWARCGTVAVCEEIDCISFHIKFESGEATDYCVKREIKTLFWFCYSQFMKSAKF